MIDGLLLSLPNPPARHTDITGFTEYDLLQFTTSTRIHTKIVQELSKFESHPSCRPAPAKGRCAACGGVLKTSRFCCPDCRQECHKQVQCRTKHSSSCRPTTFMASNSTTSSLTRKRSAPLDTTDVRSTSFRDVRPHLEDVDSDISDMEEEEEEASPCHATSPPGLTPSLTLRASLLTPGPQGVLALALAPPQPSLTLSKPVAPKPLPKNRSKAPATTPEGIQTELLQRQLVLAQTKIASIENTLKETEISNSILLDHVRLFEQRENDTIFAQHFSSSTAAPAPESAGPAGAAGAASAATAAAPRACCTNSSLMLEEFGNLRCQVQDLAGSVAVLLRAAPHPFPLAPDVSQCPFTPEAPLATEDQLAPVALEAPTELDLHTLTNFDPHPLSTPRFLLNLCTRMASCSRVKQSCPAGRGAEAAATGPAPALAPSYPQQ